MVVREFMPGYLRKKGENLATKEDIAELTRLQEEVKHDFDSLLETSKQRHGLRLAALDRRLQVHQESFALWREILSNRSPETIGPVVFKCQEWWEKNCLYLEPDVRDAFVAAYTAAHTHSAYLQVRADSRIITENWDIISRFPKILFRAIQLPPLNDVDTTPLLRGDGAKA